MQMDPICDYQEGLVNMEGCALDGNKLGQPLSAISPSPEPALHLAGALSPLLKPSLLSGPAGLLGGRERPRFSAGFSSSITETAGCNGKSTGLAQTLSPTNSDTGQTTCSSLNLNFLIFKTGMVDCARSRPPHGDAWEIKRDREGPRAL